MSKRVIIAVSNDIVTDQRVLRLARLIAESKSEITILGRELPESLPVLETGFKTCRWKITFRKGFLFYKWLNIRIFFYLLSRKPDLIISNDLDTLLPCFIISKLKRINLVFDSHEYFTGTPELKNRPFVKSFWKYIERKTLPYLDFIMTVNNSISDLYKDEYGVEALVVRNINEMTVVSIKSRRELGISSDDLVLILQGTGINIDRGGVELFEAMKDIEGVHLIVIGKGDSLEELKEMSLSDDLLDKITFLPVMYWEKMMEYTCMGDVGLSLDKGDSKNYEMSLPNKVFDYINAGLALIVSSLPEVVHVVNIYGCGLVVSEVSPVAISEKIIQIRNDRHLLDKLKNNARQTASNVTWDKEKQKAKALYSRVGLEFE